MDGVAIPLKSDRNWKVILSFASNTPVSMTSAELAHIETAAGYFLQRIEALSDNQGLKPTLSKREVEALKWSVAGKAAWEIGRIMGISETTVIAHKKLATRKLGCTNTVQAVVVAIERGLLQS